MLMRRIQAVSNYKNVIEIEEVLSEKTYHGVPKNQAEERTLDIVLMEEKKGDKKIKKANVKKQKPYEPEDVVLQGHLVPSVDIPKIRCHYFLKLTFNHSGIVLSNEIPDIVFPIHIHSANIA
mmetsp:Transcript_1211/g.746  ORF Transcript_1211/g.746 Transcript_1211/m.746 type:complete len:122 (-) Transcript_1211:233-598(-)